MGLLDRFRGGGEKADAAKSGESSTDYDALLDEAKAEAPAKPEKVTPIIHDLEQSETANGDQKGFVERSVETIKLHAEAADLLRASSEALGYGHEQDGVTERGQKFVKGEQSTFIRKLRNLSLDHEGIKEQYRNGNPPSPEDRSKAERSKSDADAIEHNSREHRASAEIARNLARVMERAQTQTAEEAERTSLQNVFWRESKKSFDQESRSPEEQALASVSSLAEAIQYIRTLTGKPTRGTIDGDIGGATAMDGTDGTLFSAIHELEAKLSPGGEGKAEVTIDLGHDTAVVFRVSQRREGDYGEKLRVYEAGVVSTIDKDTRDRRISSDKRMTAPFEPRSEADLD